MKTPGVSPQGILTKAICEDPGRTFKIFDMDKAVVYAGLKDIDNAFFYLNKTYEQRMGIACLGMIFCIRYPILNELKIDPRFKELTTKMKIEN